MRDRRRASDRPSTGAATNANPVWVAALIVSFIVPIQIQLGDIRLSFYRIVLLLAVIPVIRQLSAQPIRFRWVDYVFILFSLYGTVALAATGSSIPTLGIFLLETIGPYMLARAFIRNADQFSTAARVLSTTIIAMIPFAIFENLTRQPILLKILDTVFPVLPNVPHEQRLGLDRAQVTFDHPILFGMFCAFGFAMSIYAARRHSPPKLSLRRGSLVGLATFTSLSSGAFVAVGLQIVLIAYDRILRNVPRRWWMLCIAIVVTYVTVELLSNRTVAEISIGFLALNPGTAWTRLNVNGWALEAIMAHPFFGLGFNWSWPVPFYIVTTSIDNFWLAMGFRQGLVTMVLLILSVFGVMVTVAFTRQKDAFVNACRVSYIVTFVALSLSVVTVHLWNSAYCTFMLLLGCGMWMTETQPDSSEEVEQEPEEEKPAGLRFSRDLHSNYRR
ncbi:O-antigen ligase family protein [Psychromarinibacter sp. S121]|uniref:O-antigen ligase family protein n=1 Tax=Psychromarinibacter sp. S121 TaxID=3415127 RepID=UPI003C7D0A64